MENETLENQVLSKINNIAAVSDSVMEYLELGDNSDESLKNVLNELNIVEDTYCKALAILVDEMLSRLNTEL